MHADESNDSRPAEADNVDAAAIDVHNHAMPLPLLEWLERDGLADLSRIGDDVVLYPGHDYSGKSAPMGDVRRTNPILNAPDYASWRRMMGR